MQSLKLQSYEIPEHFSPEAKDLCVKMRGDIDKLHQQHKDQLAWVMQRFKAAMSKMRPEFITEITLRELFDEIEMTADPVAAEMVEPKEESGKKEKKQRAKKKKAIPDHLPRTIIPHDIPEENYEVQVLEKRSARTVILNSNVPGIQTDFSLLF